MADDNTEVYVNLIGAGTYQKDDGAISGYGQSISAVFAGQDWGSAGLIVGDEIRWQQ